MNADFFSSKFNILLSNFEYAKCDVRNFLVQQFCCSCFRTQLCPLFDSSLEALFRHWRIAIHVVWKVPWETKNVYLPFWAKLMNPESWCHNRCQNFII